MFFFSRVTKKSLFLSQLLLSQCSWREYKADNGRVYYHNVDSGESQWTKPKELEDIEKMMGQQQPSTDSPNTYVENHSSRHFLRFIFVLVRHLQLHHMQLIFLHK